MRMVLLLGQKRLKIGSGIRKTKHGFLLANKITEIRENMASYILIAL
jgi:hypothetical protein